MIAALVPAVVDGIVQEAIEAIGAAAVLIDPVPVAFEYARDPDDAHYINLAVAADAELIVSRDKDLLDLMDPGSLDGADLKRRFPKLTILNPVQFLQRMRSTT